MIKIVIQGKKAKLLNWHLHLGLLKQNFLLNIIHNNISLQKTIKLEGLFHEV